MLWTRFVEAVPAVCLISLAAAQSPSLPVISTFDTGPDGWFVSGDASDWAPSDGNPGGYLRGQGTGTEDPPLVSPPPSYLGDWTGLDGLARLRYDHRVFYEGNGFCTPSLPYTVTISGPGGGAIWTGDLPGTEPTDWRRIVVPIDEAAWQVQSGSWAALLSQVTELRIEMELFCNLHPPDDISGLDNIVLEANCPADLAPPFGVLDRQICTGTCVPIETSG